MGLKLRDWLLAAIVLAGVGGASYLKAMHKFDPHGPELVPRAHVIR